MRLKRDLLIALENVTKSQQVQDFAVESHIMPHVYENAPATSQSCKCVTGGNGKALYRANFCMRLIRF